LQDHADEVRCSCTQVLSIAIVGNQIENCYLCYVFGRIVEEITGKCFIIVVIIVETGFGVQTNNRLTSRTQTSIEGD
jgi:hypothetical protein